MLVSVWTKRFKNTQVVERLLCMELELELELELEMERCIATNLGLVIRAYHFLEMHLNHITALGGRIDRICSATSNVISDSYEYVFLSNSPLPLLHKIKKRYPDSNACT